MEQKKFSLVPYLLKYKWSYLIGILLLLLVDVASLYVPQYIGEIIDGLSAQTLDMQGVKTLILKLFAAGMVMAVGRFGWRYGIQGASRNVEYDLRNDMFRHLESLSAKYFNSHKTGDLMAHFTNDLQAVRQAVGMSVVTAFDAVGMTIMVLVRMVVYVNLSLTVVAAVPLTAVAVGCYFFGKAMKKCQIERQNAFSYLSDKVQESLSGIRVVKAFVQEEKDFDSFEEANEKNMEKNLAVVKLRAVFGPALDAITGISILLTLLIGGRMVLSGAISIGQFVTFNSYINMLVWPMIACGDCINSFTQASAALKRISMIFAEEPDIVDRIPEELQGKDLHIQGEIELKDLTFTYPDGTEPVLKDVSLKVEAGEMLGILGRTGSGKSSLADLLLRVYDCEKGEILLDGRPITDYPLAVLHRDVAYVPQDNFLFSDTLEENIAFGLEERITDHPEIRSRIRQAAANACIDDNIMEFPDQYETLVGERGVTLSGGQKQRSSIARALLMDAAILIMDDSLSAVDTDTEEQILENLLKLRKGKTTIVIAHRISTLQKADHVAVLTDGELTEYGTHEELISLNGFYAHIYEKQQLEEQLSQM
ncbi:MAG: ABC transporter ATP-binding protein/permease [Lachnospiraceae bacterium]|nr:ABC transporter ATP-binding protein/permease [Lachnospiraceae bacterium]